MSRKWILVAAISLLLLLLISIPIVIVSWLQFSNSFTCEELPSMSEAEAVLLARQEIIKQIEQVNQGFVSVDLLSLEQCPERGYFVISYASERDKAAIQRLFNGIPEISERQFFGIPYYLRNT